MYSTCNITGLIELKSVVNDMMHSSIFSLSFTLYALSMIAGHMWIDWTAPSSLEVGSKPSSDVRELCSSSNLAPVLVHIAFIYSCIINAFCYLNERCLPASYQLPPAPPSLIYNHSYHSFNHTEALFYRFQMIYDYQMKVKMADLFLGPIFLYETYHLPNPSKRTKGPKPTSDPHQLKSPSQSADFQSSNQIRSSRDWRWN